MVQAPPLFIQEKVHPKALINDLLRHSKTAEAEKSSDVIVDDDGCVMRHGSRDPSA